MKPAKAGAETNLNLVTSSGTIYSFLLTEKSSPPDLKVYVQGEPARPTGQAEVLLRRAGGGARIAARGSPRGVCTRRGAEAGRGGRRLSAAVSRRSFSSRTASPKYEKPFFVRSMWHDGQFTYLKSDATELPALYELKDGKPAIVNFQVREGTYVVPKVLDRGYLALGTQRFTFEQQGR